MTKKLLLLAATAILCVACTPNISMPELGNDIARQADLHKCDDLDAPEQIRCREDTERRHAEMERQIDEYEYEQRRKSERD